MKTFVIYVLTAPNGKRYVGQTCDFRERMYRHAQAKNDYAISRAIRKYGWENFGKEIVSDNVSAEDVDYFEKRWIQYFGTLAPNGYNLNNGGNGGKVVSDDTKRKLSEINKGKTLSDYAKRRISECHRGKIVSPEVILKRFISRMGMHPLSLHIEIQLYLRAGWSHRKMHRNLGWQMATIRKYRSV